MILELIKEKTPAGLMKTKYFDWLEDTIESAIEEAREVEHREIEAGIVTANEYATSGEYKHGLRMALEIVRQRKVALSRERDRRQEIKNARNEETS